MIDTKAVNHSPYPIYKRSGTEWLRDVPEHWTVTTIRRYCHVFTGATPDRAMPTYWEGGTVPWITSGDVNLRRIFKAQQSITEAGYRASSTKYIRPRSLVLALAGQGRTKGMVATVECQTTCNQSLAAVEPSPQLSDYNFLAYYLESRYKDIRALVGDGLRDGLNLEHIRGIPTPLPPIDEQAAIVRYLDHADELINRYISAKQRFIALLEEQRQAVIHQAVTCGLDPDPPLKQSPIPWLQQMPVHWHSRRLGQLATKFGSGITPRGGATVYQDTGIPFLRSQNVHFDGLRLDDVAKISYELHQSQSASHVQPLDVLLNITGASIGRVCSVPEQFGGANVNQHVCIIRPDQERLSSRFLAAFLSTPTAQEHIRTEQTGASREGLTLQSIRDFLIPLPPVPEQMEITRRIDESTDKIQKVTSLAHHQIELAHEYRARLIADAVTGQIDVRNAAPQPPE